MHLSQHRFSHGLASPEKASSTRIGVRKLLPSRAAKCPESLCPEHHVGGSGAASRPPPRRALPLRRRSYGLMRQTKSLPSPSALPLVSGLRGLLSAPAGRWSFPTLLRKSFPTCL